MDKERATRLAEALNEHIDLDMDEDGWKPWCSSCARWMIYREHAGGGVTVMDGETLCAYTNVDEMRSQSRPLLEINFNLL